MKKLGVMLLAAAFSLPVFAATQAAQQPTTEQGSKPAKAKTHKRTKKASKKKGSTASSTTETPAPAKK